MANEAEAEAEFFKPRAMPLPASSAACLSTMPSTTAGRTSEDLTHLALVPTFRLRFDEGRSPWFAEGGIGISLMDARYITPTKEFSTRFNFADRIAIGRSFGLRGEHEVALQLQHVSNAGIKEPNPGENFLQLRYGVAF